MQCNLNPSNRCSLCGHQYEKPGHYECVATGLGDLIESLATAVGIKSCDACKRRRDYLNRIRLK